MFDLPKRYDVLVVGGGNAGLCAAIAARQHGASVLLLEQETKRLRGGNSRHARNLRLKHDTPGEFQQDVYSDDEFWHDLSQVTGGNADEKLARLMISESARVPHWMAQCGAYLQRPKDGATVSSRRTAFLLGGGKALLNAYYLTAARLGIDVLYDAEVRSLPLDDGFFREAVVRTRGSPAKVRAKAVVVSSGGIQANIDWLKRCWGDAADHFSIRGAASAKGQVLTDLLDQNVAAIGDPKLCHMVAVDARTPKFDGGIVTRLDCVPFGIVVDRSGRRIYDEGAEVGPKRYAVWGKLVARCPDQRAYAVFDANAENHFRPSIYPPIRAQTIEALAAKLALDPQILAAVVSAYNDAVRSGGCGSDEPVRWRTEGVTPPKTRWALPIRTPPFGSYPLRPGITFSYLGIKVDENARVLMSDGRPAKNVFAAGLIMAANILDRGYLAGLGMTISTVFGRIAGNEAAKYASH